MLSEKAQDIYREISKEGTKLGDLRNIAKGIKKDHELGEGLWNTGEFLPRLLAILIFDPKMLSPQAVDTIIADIGSVTPEEERLQLTDWFMANQLTKDKKFVALIESWEDDSASLKRRIFWYYQGRLRWTGQVPPDNTKELLVRIEAKLPSEVPEVQWAMNFTAGWIGIFDTAYRNQCINMGEKLGLYKDEVVPRNCSPNYLPKFIEQEVKKRKL